MLTDRPARALALMTGVFLVVLQGVVPMARADEARQWQAQIFATLELADAWKISRGKGVTVGLVDSGADVDHQDLKGSVRAAPDMLEDWGDARRQHGTAMASIIAGHGHAGGADGVMGVAPEARIISIRALAEKEDPGYDSTDEGEDTAIARAVRYAVDHGAGVVNMSLGKYGLDLDTRRAVAYAIGRGAVVVASAGNEEQTRKKDAAGFAPYSYPASYPGVIGVAATRPDHKRAAFSNRNYSVLLGAPGVNVPAAWPGGGYRLISGTSPAAALVSGVAALIRARHPKLAPAMVAQAMIDGTRHRPRQGYGPDLGFGEVDAAAALRAADTLAVGALAGGGRMRGHMAEPGFPPRRRFGAGAGGPVSVLPGSSWLIAGFVLVAAASLAGLVASVLIAGMYHRRRGV